MREFAADPPEEEQLAAVFAEREESVAIAESCTGGLVSSLVTDVSGSSAYFDRGVVTYSYDSKRNLLAVDREALDEHGAVSAPVARQMAAGIRDIADTTWGLATTGVAGPTGGSEETPVGTVFVGVAYAGEWGSGDSFTDVRRYQFDGDRLEVKEQVARGALRDLGSAIKGQRTD